MLPCHIVSHRVTLDYTVGNNKSRKQIQKEFVSNNYGVTHLGFMVCGATLVVVSKLPVVSSCLADFSSAVIVVGVCWFPWFHALPAEAVPTLALHATERTEALDFLSLLDLPPCSLSFPHSPPPSPMTARGMKY